MAKVDYELYDESGKILVAKQIDTPDVPYDIAREQALAPLDGEGMDAMRKTINALAAGQSVPQEYLDYMSKVEAIKAANPKPQGE